MKLKNYFVAALLLVGVSAQAQMMPSIPQDKDVRVGKLDPDVENPFPDLQFGYFQLIFL